MPDTTDSAIMRPQLRRTGAVSQLHVRDQPMLLTAGEVRNSSSSSRVWMQDVWDKCKRANLNTVLAVVPWDMMEPEEGTFDFTIIDELIEDARKFEMKLVPLWFGAWKNGYSHYCPAWVKKDTKRFPRCRVRGAHSEIMTPLGEENKVVTARAFSALMKHIHEVDEGEFTATMVQVENEAGLRGDTRDRSALAEEAWNAPVPTELTRYLAQNRDKLVAGVARTWTSGREEGTWPQVFGDNVDGERIFMAWHYSRFVEFSTVAGKAEHDIPMFVNAIGGGQPGAPRSDTLNIWLCGAPSIDMISPDIYGPEFEEMFDAFNVLDNPMFVPEGPAELEGSADAYYAIGQGAIGYSPFGVEERIFDFEAGPMLKAFGLLNQLAPQILQRQAQGAITSAKVSRETDLPGNWKLRSRHIIDRPLRTVTIGGYHWNVALNHYWRTPENPIDDIGYVIIMHDGPDEFTLAGYGVQIAHEVAGDDSRIAAILSIDEMVFLEGKWENRRRLNGDEIITSYKIDELLPKRQTGTAVKFWLPEPQVFKVKLYSYDV